MKKIMVFVLVAGLAFTVSGMANCGVCGADKAEAKSAVESSLKAEEHKGEHTTLTGTLVCTGCDLKKAEGARAACGTYGHTHALKTADGHYVNFLGNDYSADLIKGEKYHNKKITVHGVQYASANLMDVDSYEVDDKKIGWCNHCKAMDGCAAMTSK